MLSVYIILFCYFMINVNYRIMKEVNIKKNTAASLHSCQILPQMYLQFTFESNGPNVTF